jgi:hypothetical protein
MNAKDDQLPIPGTTAPTAFTAEALHSIDKEIRSVFSDDELITPDMIQGKYKTLKEAVTTQGWPALHDVEGRFLFVLDETGKKLEEYLNPDGSLSGRVLFVNANESQPCAAIRIVNDPVKDKTYIEALVKKGFIVRTRADADTKEARENSYDRFHAAIESGAQVITTDYYAPSKFFPSKYHVVFSNGGFVKENSVVIQQNK